MKSKLKFVIPLALILALGGYKLVLAKPAPAPKPKIAGQIYVLPKEFLLNLADGKFAKINVALVLEEGSLAAGGHAAETPPEGYGALPQEAVVRDIITNTISDASGRQLISRDGRERLKKRVLKQILKNTDVKATEVLFTDVAVQ
jgi:flagellar basal body-associated protein FliL